jgi:Zn-dependent protease/predicted transcriptional regulator
MLSTQRAPQGDVMNTTFRLGRIAGIPIGLSWTWIPVFGLFVWSLAANVFPSTNPGLATGTYVAMGVAAALLFFASLLLHELGHALRARRDGVEIDGITLWLLGGVARFRGRFPSAGAEFRIAVAGPLVSAGLAASFITLAALTHLNPAIDGVLAWLGYINLLLLVFNLLPALPLDGGRILRSALWHIKGDHAPATRIAAVVGIGIGALMITLGTVTVFMASGFSGVWLAFIGWFILSAARAELRLVSLQGALEGFVVADLMSHHPIVSQANQTIRDFMAVVPADDPSAAYPVLDGLRPVGILPSPRGLTRNGAGEVATLWVRDRMVHLDRLPLLTPDEPAPEAMLAMVDAHAESALVMDHGHLAGIVSSRDIAEALKLGERRQWSHPPGRTDPGRRN